ncbi:PilZ domain-containing protein [Oceanisphaera avium]|uniref:Cyclic diguanosine monophosphate-binding protein n=1 Tax=Oceanisphaera avium TaxID=1903694 RepID=A0A1Y0CXH5_9GAMM|nr:PilZ domain-containing protein [Oceanisphaera avium]ART79999.1 hypothetical protein CBP12_07450 [Oceanisphaera avium]
MAERRIFTRVEFSSPAWIITLDGEQHSVLVQDLSIHGALLKVTEPWQAELNAPLELRLSLDGEHKQIIMQARQRFHQHECIGIECELLDIESASRLRRLMELNLGEEALLLRQFEELLDSRPYAE